MVEELLNVLAVVGVFMGQEELGGRNNLAWLIAVHAGDLVGPLPPLPDVEESEPADAEI
jgi:hypothetical protein